MTGFVCFDTASGSYAVPVEQSVRVLAAPTVTPLPDPRPHVLGLVDHDGEMIPLVAISDAVATGDAHHVLVVDAGERRLAVAAGHVSGVRHITTQEITGPPRGQDQQVITGVVAADGRLVVAPAELAGLLR